MDRRILDILVCPICKGSLKVDNNPAQADVQAELICTRDRLAFPVKDDIPVMLVESARTIDQA
ncbi:MAG: Trm112 family protein [Burkholderiaceae bacterium]